MKLLLYCCKQKPYLNCDFGKDNHEDYSGNWNIYLANKQNECSNIVNGKIVAECDFEVEEFDYMKAECLTHTYLDLLKKSCLTDRQMYDYLKGKNGYVIHIKNLHIFDKPRELNEVYKIDNVGGVLFTHTLKKAPQNMMRVSINRWWLYGAYTPNDVNILISIKPEWLCKILNGEKTIEVRKKVLRGMLGNA